MITPEQYADLHNIILKKAHGEGKFQNWDFSNNHEIWNVMDEIIKKIAGNSACGKISASIDEEYG